MQRIEENKIVRRKAELNRAVSWSELGSDLLGDIMGRLRLTDQARFHAVCKSWRHVCPIKKSHAVFKPKGLESASISSWFVHVDRRIQENTSTLELRLYAPYPPIHNPISVHTISLSELGIPNITDYSICIRIVCKYNWLFISITNREQQGPCAQIYFILFSPLTKTLKQLPPCLDSSLWDFEQSFSSDPESADCVFLLFDKRSMEDKFTVSTYRKDDKDWTARQFANVQDFQRAGCKTMYTGGVFYIVSSSGQVASYNAIKEEINYESLSKDDDLAENYSRPPHEFLMVIGEHMYVVCNDKISCTKRFDRSNKVWIQVSSLQDSANVDDEKPHSAANMIEFSGNGCLICSSRSFNLDLLMTCSWPRFSFRDLDLLTTFSSQIYFGIEDWYRKNSVFWIKPPLISM